MGSLPVQGVLADAYACIRLNKPYSFGQKEFAARLQSDGVPCILMDGDMADKRDHAAGGRRSRLEAILERMEKRLDPKRTK